MKEVCLRRDRKLSWQQHYSCIPHSTETGRYAISTDRKSHSHSKTAQMKTTWCLKECCNHRGGDGVKVSSQNNRGDNQLIPLRVNSTNWDREIFHCAALAEAWVDQRLCRAPCLRAIWAYRPTISFYLNFCSAAGLPSLLRTTAPVTLESLKPIGKLYWNKVLLREWFCCCPLVISSS